MEKKRGETKINGFRKKLMIPETEISECPVFEVESKIGNIFVNEKICEEYSVKIYKINSYFYEHYGKKYNLMKMDVNRYYLELMFVLLNILQLQKLMKKGIRAEILFLRRKAKKHQKKNLVVNLLQLIRVEQVMMQTLKLVEYKHLLVNLMKKKKKELEDEIKKLKLQLINQSV